MIKRLLTLFVTMACIQNASAIPVTKIMSDCSIRPNGPKSAAKVDCLMTDDHIMKLLLRKDLNHLLLSDVLDLMKSLQREFPEAIKLESIGKTYQGRDMPMIVLDARDYLLKTMGIKAEDVHIQQKPAILIPGAHHARELTSI